MKTMTKLCPCGSTLEFQQCCEPFLKNTTKPKTPEALMRSRYTAYTVLDIDYVAKTMKSPAIDDFDAKKALEWSKQATWLGLEIIKAENDAPDHGYVEFKANYQIADKLFCLHEKSEFRKEADTWFYIEGEEVKVQTFIRQEEKIGRNDPCSCGSKKKYKKCCGAA
jgi:SEC-C motif-containing protein